jgi:chromosome partitioning protein
VSDLVIVPLSPSPLDFEATGSVFSVVEGVMEHRPKLITRILVSRSRPNAKMTRLLFESIASAGYTRFKTAIKQRESYVTSMLAGQTVFDTNDGQAKGEIQILIREILQIFNLED